MRLSPFPVPFGQTPDISVGPLLGPERSARSERVLRGLSQAAVIFVPNTTTPQPADAPRYCIVLDSEFHLFSRRARLCNNLRPVLPGKTATSRGIQADSARKGRRRALQPGTLPGFRFLYFSE